MESGAGSFCSGAYVLFSVNVVDRHVIQALPRGTVMFFWEKFVAYDMAEMLCVYIGAVQRIVLWAFGAGKGFTALALFPCMYAVNLFFQLKGMDSKYRVAAKGSAGAGDSYSMCCISFVGMDE